MKFIRLFNKQSMFRKKLPVCNSKYYQSQKY